MPSDKYIDLSLPASEGTVTAPADGYLQFRIACGTASNPYITLGNNTRGYTDRSWMPGTAASMILTIFLPVNAGDVIKVEYSANGASRVFRLFYTNGSAPVS